MMQVQRQTGVALWRQIADRIATAIAAGDYDATGMLPPETVLAERFGVNRHTVRSAIAALSQEGMVRPLQGRGTLIERRDRLNFPIGRRTRFSAGLGDQAREMRGLLLGHAEEPASGEVAAWLKLTPGAPVIRLETLRKADLRPVSRATTWFPAARFPGIAEAYAGSESITKAFAAMGLSDYVRARTEITARHAGAEDLESLELSPGAILLITKALNTDLDGNPVQYAISRFAADRVQFSVDYP